MTNTQILHAGVLDILFEHRNKLYGAYVLRKTYNKRLSLSILISLTLVSAFLFSSFLKNENGNRLHFRTAKESVIIRTFVEPNEPPPPPLMERRPPVATSDYRPIVVVPDELADTVITETDALDSTAIGTENIEGIPPGDIVRPPEITNNSNVNTALKNTDDTNEIIIEEKTPAFPGGSEAWLTFLRRFLQSPEELEPGQRVDVLVRFWVDADGSVSRPEILKSGGPAFDREVLRVMKKMPRWEPAIQNGRKIAVYYAQPKSFVGVEE